MSEIKYRILVADDDEMVRELHSTFVRGFGYDVELAADVLESLGVTADALIGQSLGESAGLFAMRIWRDRDGLWRRVQESSLFGSDLAPPYEAAREFWGLWEEEKVDWVVGVLSAPVDDVRLMRENCGPGVQIKASGGMRSYDDARRFVDLGAARLGTSSTKEIAAGERGIIAASKADY